MNFDEDRAFKEAPFDPLHFLIVVVRLWHNVTQWEPGLVRVREDFFGTAAAQSATGVRTADVTKLPGGTDNFTQPAFEIWYAPTIWGGRGFTLCSSLSLLALERAMRTQPVREPPMLFDVPKTQRPALVVSTKVCTARSTIPPFLDDDACGLLRVQMDWAIQNKTLDVLQKDETKEGTHCVEHHGKGKPCMYCVPCTHFGPLDASDAFKLVALWRETELRAEIERLKTKAWGDDLVADPRKVTLAGRSQSPRNRRVRP